MPTMGIGELSGMPDQMLVLRGEEPCDKQASHPGREVILQVTSCFGNRDELPLNGLLRSSADSERVYFYTLIWKNI